MTRGKRLACPSLPMMIVEIIEAETVKYDAPIY